ncbi:LamG-like jellyroll fold domain-containing protein [Aestuariivivens insulae]|uniref:LamG-like jellyroll fold domain-containing protein n=1 Tax=Aestuariivivens insulae TaxID=1621988 RepID=UPI001F5A784F|nr:LamG-like jellyroll fold domain-containing protein [Aestuariivivens insulae]
MVIDKFLKLTKKYLLLLLFFALFITKQSHAQNDLMLNDYVFASQSSADSIAYKLQQGARAFLLEVERTNTSYAVKSGTTKKPLETVLSDIEEFLAKEDSTLIALVFKGTIDQEAFLNYLKTHLSENFFLIEGDHWPKIESLKARDVELIVGFEQDLAETSIERVRNENKYLDRFSRDPIDKLVLFRTPVATDTTLFNHVFEFWKTTGTAPHFIEAPNMDVAHVKYVVDSLNRTRRFRGVVEYKGALLNEVSWRKSPKIMTPAKFSFPLIQKEQVLSPYKNGYRITPAEVIHHASQTDAPRLFTAYDVALEDALEYDFSFDKSVVNHAEQDWDRIITKDISFITDPERGPVLYLNTLDAFIDYSKPNTLDFETPISVSAWLKPEKEQDFMGIVGVGLAFSVKLNKSMPDFTTATIKDHMVEQPLKLGIWQHLVVVYNPRTTVDFYLNGEKIGNIDTSEIIPSNQSLVIGNNIWGEQFYGSIDNLKIWDRGLSQKEVTMLFEGDNEASGSSINYMFLIIGVIIFVFIMIIAIVIYKRKGIKNTMLKVAKPYIKHEPRTEAKKDRLSLFGSFQLKLIEGQEPSFSPLHKQLVSFLVLSALDEKDGVTTNKLTETFWPGVSKVKAKENRNGNIRKLRMVLSQIDGLQVVFEDKRWRMVNAESLEVDVFEYIRLKEQIERDMEASGTIALDALETFLELLKKGNVLQSTQTEWADYFKAKLSNEIEYLLSKIYHTHHTNLPEPLCVKMAKTILLFDSLNENALQILIIELVALGKHGLAQNAYVTFSKNYEALYAEPYHVNYQDLLKK